MPIYFNTGFKEIWDENTIRMKLLDLSMAKKDTWIHANLSVSESNRASRCLWSLVAKRFDSLRSLYFINPSTSARCLNRLGALIAKEPDPELYQLFLKAASNFALITNHPVDCPQNPYLNSQAPVMQTSVPPLMQQSPVFVQTPTLISVTEPPRATVINPVVIHEVHEHRHVSSVPVVVVDHGIRSKRFPQVTSGYVAPRHRPPLASNRGQAPITTGHEIPGSGRREAAREIAPALAAQNIHLSSRPKVMTSRPLTPAITVAPLAAKRMAPPPAHRGPVRHAPVPTRLTPGPTRQQQIPSRTAPTQGVRAPAANHGLHVPVGGRK